MSDFCEFVSGLRTGEPTQRQKRLTIEAKETYKRDLL